MFRATQILVEEIGGFAFCPVALLALGNWFQLSLTEDGFHLNLTSTGTEKLLRACRATGILANVRHHKPPLFKVLLAECSEATRLTPNGSCGSYRIGLPSTQLENRQSKSRI